MALSTSKPRIEGLGLSKRQVAIVKPEHIKRGILIMLALALVLTIAAVVKGISNSHSYQQRLDQRRIDRQKTQDEAAKRTQANNVNPAASFQQDVATFKKDDISTAPAAAGATAAIDPATGKPGTTTGPNAMSEKVQEAINEDRLRAIKDVHEPLALAVPSGDKPVGTTTTSSVRVVQQPAQDATDRAPAQAAPDAQTQALLQQRARLVEQLHLLQSQSGAQQ